jgi:hypothetical protein
MMQWRKAAAMISTVNEYSHLKWPLTFASVLTTLLAFILLLSFRSDSWFTYELIHTDNESNTTSYSRLLEYGSLGLWTICVGHYNDLNVKCDLWTKETRPHSFNVIIVLVSCALFLSNLTVFPSWGTSILILYNINNRYIRHIVGFIWILLFLTLSLTIILMVTMLLIALTQFYSPGKFIIDTDHLFFHSSQGLIYASFGKTSIYFINLFIHYCVLATFLAIICLILVVATLIWKKLIEMRSVEAERDLLKQLSDDSYKPGWHKIVMAPRTPLTNDPIDEPPPYEY